MSNLKSIKSHDFKMEHAEKQTKREANAVIDDYISKGKYCTVDDIVESIYHKYSNGKESNWWEFNFREGIKIDAKKIYRKRKSEIPPKVTNQTKISFNQ